MEPRHLFTIRWTQPYPQNELTAYVDALRRELIEHVLDDGDFAEANAVIDRIRAL
jgi:hypothetical protein